MTKKTLVDRWDSLVSRLEDDVTIMSDVDLLSTSNALDRVAEVRRFMRAKLLDTFGERAGRTDKHIPTDSLGRRQMLRQMIARQSRDVGAVSVSFQNSDQLSDTDVDSLLYELLSGEETDVEGQPK